MKRLRLFQRFFVIILFLAICTTSWARTDFTVNGINYGIYEDGTGVYVAKNNNYSGSAVIPSYVWDPYTGEKYAVTGIGYEAFEGCTGLTSVNIPPTVISIGSFAFHYCSSLTSIIISGFVKNIGGYAFSDCTGLTSVTIGDGVKYIGEWAFCGCTSLTSIVIPNSVISIGETAFGGCIGLTSASIGNSVTSIGKQAFNGCTGLTSVTIPNSVKSIGESAFKECIGLTSVSIGNSVTSIGKSAFERCSSLTSVTVPNSVTSIGEAAFYNCSGLTSVTIPNSVTSIGGSAFSDCSNLTSISIPNSVTSIEGATFYNCKSLTSIELPNNVTNIGAYAFYDCTGLTSFTIPEKVISIGYGAFMSCSSLTSITIPGNVTSIDYGAFWGCSNLTKTEFASIESLCSIRFNHETSNPLYWVKHLYINGQEVTDLIIPESVTSIGSYSFYNCTDLTSVKIPNSVTNIGAYAFCGCSGLTSVTIPQNVEIIGYRAFMACSLKEVYCLVEHVPDITYSESFGYTETLYVPASLLEAYKSTYPWNRYFESIMPIDDHYSQTPVQNVGELNNRQIYTAVTKRAAWYVPTGSTQLETTEVPTFVYKNSRNSNQQFAFIQHNGQYYIYCVGEGKILNGQTSNNPNRGMLVTKDCQPVTITETGDEEYPLFFTFGDDYNLNVGGGNQIIINNWSTIDDGNKVALRPVQAVMLDENDINRIIGYISGTTIIDDHYSQTPVQNIVELDNKQVYTAETKRAAWYVPTGSTQLETTEFPTIVSKSSTNSNQQFAFIQHGGKFYIYCVGEGKILNGKTSNTPNRGVLVTENCQPVTITETSDTDYPLFFTFGEDFNINVGGGNQITIDTWSTLDDGNKVALRHVQGVTLSDKEMRRIIGYIDGCFVGDANGNGEVEIGDVTSVLTLMATPDATGYNNKAADANANGEIEIGDVTTILTIMAGGGE